MDIIKLICHIHHRLYGVRNQVFIFFMPTKSSVELLVFWGVEFPCLLFLPRLLWCGVLLCCWVAIWGF
jgi:hypothetical protein